MTNPNTSEVKIWPDGSERWYLHNKLHREDGPAVIYPDGSKHWFLNGDYHREDGPAIEWPDGTKEWYLNGTEFSNESELKNALKSISRRSKN